jgi:peptide/nickel transport system substrate-binding protein
MRRRILASMGLLAGLTAGAAPALADRFKCPHVGGDFTFGQEANINSLDQMTSATISTRNIAMNVFEALMTRDENFSPILDLAASMTEAPDHLTYTFKLPRSTATPASAWNAACWPMSIAGTRRTRTPSSST